MSNEWEIVLKGGKHKPKQQISNKEQKRIQQNNLSNNKYRLVLDEDTDKSMSPEQNKISGKSKKPNLLKTEVDINKQINKITSESIKKIYTELLQRFPNQYTVALLDLAVHLSLMIKMNEDHIKNINFDQIDFPYAFLSSDSKSALNNIFGSLSNVFVSNFIKSAMIQLLDDFDKGISSIGLRILIQACVRIKQTVFITNRKNFFDLLNLNREHTVKFKLLTWVFQQACSNYNMACQIWLIYFLPFITQRCHTEFVIGFGEEIRDYPIDVSGNDTNLLVTDFVPIIDLIFTQNTNGARGDRKVPTQKRKQVNFQLTPAQIDRLKQIYPKIKEQAFFSKTPTSLKDYFASLFLRLSTHTRNEPLNEELLKCLEHCVNMCPESIDQLGHLHREYPQQTRIFLDYLTNGTSSAVNTIKKSRSFKCLMEKIHTATLAAPQGSVNDNLRQLTKTYQSRRSSGYGIGLLMRLFVYLLVLLGCSGALFYYKYPAQCRWLESHVRPHVELVMEHATPVYQNCRTRLEQAYLYWRPTVLTVAEKARLRSLEVWTAVHPYLVEVWATVRPYMIEAGVALDHAVRYLKSKTDELLPHVLVWVNWLASAANYYLTLVANETVLFLKSLDFDGMTLTIRGALLTAWHSVESSYRQFLNYYS